jgi:hypothetical protein
MDGAHADIPHSEKKIDLIGDRLTDIKACFKHMPERFSPGYYGNVSNPALNHAHTPMKAFVSLGAHSSPRLRDNLMDQATPIDAIDATANSHSVLASQMLDQTLGENLLTAHSSALADALSSLTGMLGKMNENPNSTELDTILCKRSVRKASPPSLTEIYAILENSDSKDLHKRLYETPADECRRQCTPDILPYHQCGAFCSPMQRFLPAPNGRYGDAAPLPIMPYP